MKFIHTGDIHLGAGEDEYRKREIWESFFRFISVVKEQKPDILLISGDLFHQQPLLKELREINSLFAKVKDTKVVIIAGNHDYINKNSHYNGFEWERNVYFIKDKDVAEIEFPKLNLSVFGLSYYGREATVNLYENAIPRDKNRVNILIAHGGDKNHSPMSSEWFKKSEFDYIALGHIHKPGVVVQDKAAYSGSLEPLDISETGKHGFILGNIEKGNCSIRFVEHSCRKYCQEIIDITGIRTNVELRDKIEQIISKDSLYKVVLTGTSKIELDMEMFYRISNVIEIENKTNPDYDINAILATSENEILKRFIARMQGNEETKLNAKAMDFGISALLKH